MSYSSWTVDGYGICADDIEGVTTQRLLHLVKRAPNFKQSFMKQWEEWGTGCPIEKAPVDELLEYEDDFGYHGLAPILQSVIRERENIHLVVADDYNGVYYLLFEPFYPWSAVTPKEKCATEKDIKEMLEEYVQILTDKPIKVTYYSVENGG